MEEGPLPRPASPLSQFVWEPSSSSPLSARRRREQQGGLAVRAVVVLPRRVASKRKTRKLGSSWCLHHRLILLKLEGGNYPESDSLPSLKRYLDTSYVDKFPGYVILSLIFVAVMGLLTTCPLHGHQIGGTWEKVPSTEVDQGCSADRFCP